MNLANLQRQRNDNGINEEAISQSVNKAISTLRSQITQQRVEWIAFRWWWDNCHCHTCWHGQNGFMPLAFGHFFLKPVLQCAPICAAGQSRCQWFACPNCIKLLRHIPNSGHRSRFSMSLGSKNNQSIDITRYVNSIKDNPSFGIFGALGVPKFSRISINFNNCIIGRSHNSQGWWCSFRIDNLIGKMSSEFGHSQNGFFLPLDPTEMTKLKLLEISSWSIKITELHSKECNNNR